MNPRGHLLTEQRLAESSNLDAMSVEEALAVMNQQDRICVEAVAKIGPEVARAVRLITERMRRGGRLFYVGAGTSGRIGSLDASECPPTFRTDPSLVQNIIAGGDVALTQAREGAEDVYDGSWAELKSRNVGPNDVVCGIAAGGTTPFVHGALQYAKNVDAGTIFLLCVQPFEGEPQVDVTLRPLTGPEVLTGSTRLKAGTATKLVLNQLTTLTMVQLGKCYGNLMVDLAATNIKLWERGARIVSTITGLEQDASFKKLQEASGKVKVAVVMIKKDCTALQAQKLLDEHSGLLRDAIA